MQHLQHLKQVHLYVSGRVQGVFYRQTAVQNAQELGITGWVRNLSDGRVEIVAEGEQAALERFVDLCRQGPQAAEVSDVDEFWLSPSHSFTEFETVHL